MKNKQGNETIDDLFEKPSKNKLEELLGFTCGNCQYFFNMDNGQYELKVIVHHSSGKSELTHTHSFCSADCLDKWNNDKNGIMIL